MSDDNVLTGAPISYWGAYCPQHNVWMQKPNGDIVYYPDPAVTQAALDTSKSIATLLLGASHVAHLWEVTRFGQQRPLHPDQKTWPFGLTVCPATGWEAKRHA